MRALIYAHFDPHGRVDDHVLYTLRCYRPYFDVISFVSTAELSHREIMAAKAIADVVIKRSNVGYDFMSWRIGFEGLRLSQFEEVVFANDSCYGPCSDVGPLLSSVLSSPFDLWGVALNRQFRPHVQSFLMSFRKNLITSGFARRFWSSVEPVSDKSDLIFRYEVGLSAAVEAAGFTIGGLVDLVDLDRDTRERAISDNEPSDPEVDWLETRRAILSDDVPNPVQLYWGEALRRGCPLVKVELLRDNPLGANRRNVIARLRSGRWFEVGLIERHLERVAPRSWAQVFGVPESRP